MNNQTAGCHQRNGNLLDLEAWIREWAKRMQARVNEAGTLRQLHDSAPLVPHPSDLSRMASGERHSYWERIGQQILAAYRVGWGATDLEAAALGVRSLCRVIAANAPGPSMPALLRKAVRADADEDVVRSDVLSDGKVTGGEARKLVEAIDREEAAKSALKLYLHQRRLSAGVSP